MTPVTTLLQYTVSGGFIRASGMGERWVLKLTWSLKPKNAFLLKMIVGIFLDFSELHVVFGFNVFLSFLYCMLICNSLALLSGQKF